MRFNDMPLSDGTKDAVAAMGYEETTPIQEKSIPHLLAGRDVIARARTGTGKTAAFGIPLVEALRDTRDTGVLGLVLLPTRELALQVQEVLSDLARGTRIQVVPVYGGTGFGAQIEALRRRAPTVLVACPGRLLDLVGRGDADLSHVQVLVLDEADRMLDMGFVHDMRRVLKLVPRQRQTSLFSATIDARVRSLSGEFLHDPVSLEAEEGPTATTLTEQWHLRVEKSDKTHALLTLLHAERPAKAVVFTRTKHLAKRLAQRLSKEGWASVALQGNMTQGQRERSMAAFREGGSRLLVATDVAARGLDVPDITHVFNFDLSHEPEAYVHRIGRTGRNGRTGRSFTFIQSDEVHDLKVLEKLAGTRIPPMDLPPMNVAPGPDPVHEPTSPRAAGPRPSAKGGAGRQSGGTGGYGGGDRRGRGRSRHGGRGPGGSQSGGRGAGGHRGGSQGARQGAGSGRRRRAA